jgi:hypothetical protein
MSIVAKVAVYTVAAYLVAAILPLAALYWVLVAGVGSCLTETLKRFSNVSGYDFEVTHTGCDFIAKDESVRVLVSSGARTQQTLLFKYDPAVQALPVVELVGANAFRISVPRISSLIYRRDRWENLSFDYDIGSIEYPESALDSKQGVGAIDYPEKASGSK